MQGLEIGAQKKREAQHGAVQAQDEHEVKLIIEEEKADDERDHHVKNAEGKFEAQHFTEVLTQQVAVLGDVPVIKVGETEIEQDIQNEGKTEDGKVLPVTDVPDLSLDLRLYKNGPERLD
jgi:hypothetical protein